MEAEVRRRTNQTDKVDMELGKCLLSPYNAITSILRINLGVNDEIGPELDSNEGYSDRRLGEELACQTVWGGENIKLNRSASYQSLFAPSLDFLTPKH